MHIEILGNGSTYQNSVSISGSPAFTLAGDQITFVNTGLGRITQAGANYPAIVISGMGSFIQNHAGAVIQGFGGVVIAGGEGNDTLQNDGAIYGIVDLGNGDDHVVIGQTGNSSATYVLGDGADSFEFRFPAGATYAAIQADGGTGIDQITLTGQVYSLGGQNITNFERLVIDAPIGDPFQGYANNLSYFSGFSNVEITPGSIANFLHSANPLADLAVRGGSTNISRGSVFKSLMGSEQSEFVWIDGDGHVLGTIDLKGGNDTYFLYTDGSKYVTPTSVLGGAGEDALKLVTSGQWDIDLSIYSGFEWLGDGGNPRNFELTLRHADDYIAIDFTRRDLLKIVDSVSPDAYVNGLAGHVEISASSIVGRYGFATYPGYDDNNDHNHTLYAKEPNAVPALSTEIINHGTILGNVQLYFGDDLYDGSSGSAFGIVYGYAGNDTLLGGTGVDRLFGGYGFDILRGNAGDDVLSGDDGNDTLDGGSGNDVLDGGAGDDFIWDIGGSDTLRGGDGDDRFTVWGGRDIVDGGTGSDTLVLAGTRDSYTVFAIDGQTYLIGKNEGILGSDIETVQFSDGTASWNSVVLSARPFDTALYLATNLDVARYATNPAYAANHFAMHGFQEGRAAGSFDPLEYIASYGDLILAFGPDTQAASTHYAQFGINEGRRSGSFDAVEYIASHGDLILAYGSDAAAGVRHYISHGFKEGRQADSFDALEYLASNWDLIRAYGADAAAGARHYVSHGFKEGRQTGSFDAFEYLASNWDLIMAYGADAAAGARHYVSHGFNEGRQTDSFDALEYIASNWDLIMAYGADAAAGTRHYVSHGFNEGRETDSFDIAAYQNAHPELAGLSPDAVLINYIAEVSSDTSGLLMV